jgi:AbrB family looped-hinge helix DNA binding protein
MTAVTKLNVTENGRVVIPAEFRKALGIHKGGQILVWMEDDELRMTTMQRRIENAQRMVRKYVKPGVSLVDELIADRRREARND